MSTISLKQAVAWRQKQKKLGKRVVFTNGCFDIIHRGHVRILEYAKGLGDVLVAGLNSDASVKKLKGPGRPINNQKDRAAVLAAFRAVDLVIIFGEETPEKLIKSLKPDILVKGADYKISQIVGRRFAAKVVRMPLVKGYCTTKIINDLCAH
ncbi:MAG: adenylyltransferase/cytidyltransferase family protein [Elusimicrobia bacterium]|nr:adenylyltransferase/cytidyltransferase family protein [Elusimicrobiota bacterium]